MADGVNWNFNAHFTDFTTGDVESQRPSPDYFKFDHENGGKPIESPGGSESHAQTSTPDNMKPGRVSRSRKSRSSIQPMRVLRKSFEPSEVYGGDEVAPPKTPDVSMITEEENSVVKTEVAEEEVVLQHRSSTPDQLGAAERIRVTNSTRRSSSSRFSIPTPDTVKKQPVKRKFSTPRASESSQKPKRQKKQLTVPKTPSFMREQRTRRNFTIKTETNAHQDTATAMQRRKRETFAKRARMRVNNNSVLSSANTTQASILGISQDKVHSMQTRRETALDDFVKNLRSSAAPSKRPLSTTVPVTPKLTRPRPRFSQTIQSTEDLQCEENKKQFKASGVLYPGLPFIPKLNTRFTVAQLFGVAGRSLSLKQFKASGVQHPGLPFIPKLNTRFTVAQPFGVDGRSQQMMARKENKIRNIVQKEREMREFVANPMPIGEHALPDKVAIDVTRPEPFDLRTGVRGKFRKQMWDEQMQREKEEDQEKKAFHASRVLRSKFVPQPSLKPCTEFEEFDFNTDRRSTERHEMESARYQQNLADMGLIRQQEEERQLKEAEERSRLLYAPKPPFEQTLSLNLEERRQKEAEERSRLRAETVHRANPITKYKSLRIKKSDRPITAPVTPKFSTRFKK